MMQYLGCGQCRKILVVHVWVLPQNKNTTVPIGAEVLTKVGARVNIRDDDLNEYWISEEEIIRPMHPASILGVEDMTYLEELQEYSILRNLQIRYRKDLIYTYVGSILIAINPYKPLPIYGKNKMLKYRKKRLGELPPHIFGAADHSYESMRKMSEKWCIIVSGESGGGKTENTKLFLQYFATISPKILGKERQILESSPILEANVETVKSIAKDTGNVCTLLQVSEQRLNDSLTKKTISMQGDNVVKLLSKEEAVNSRDAFVKKIFENLFNFIIEKINEVLSKGGKNSHRQIGILDIFGFEVFDRNSFEQLCINYANEKLHQFFIEHVFKIEQEQYLTEGITWKFVEYPDNTEILQLIEAGPRSILSVIDDSTKIPKSTDHIMLDKLIELNKENPFFLKPKFKCTLVFGIQHFAGIVLYDTKDFIEKNCDSYGMDIKQVVRESENHFFKKIFASDFEADCNGVYRRRLETLVSKFKNSLDSLMNELNQSRPFFVRCIKPNEMKMPKKFDRMLCCKQLKYSGMTEVAKLRGAGYPVRYDFFQFVQHYRVLVLKMPPAQKTDYKNATLRICRAVFRNFPNADYQTGRTKIFFKQAEELFLEAEKKKALYSYAVTIQKFVRGWLVRRRHLKLKKSVALVEKCWMERQRRIQSYKILNGFYRLQAKLNSRRLIKQFFWYRRFITRLQAYCRGYLIRNSIKQKPESRNCFSQPTKYIDPLEQVSDSAYFKDFAKKYFQGNQSHKFSKKPLKKSLTRLIRPDEIAASKAIWLTILRYIHSKPEPQEGAKIGFVNAQLKEILQAMSKVNRNVSSLTQKDSDSKEVNQLYNIWLKRQTTDIEKLHFIIGHGIKRTELRDEIYCQICKILTNNPSKKAAHRGWELLSSCTGCFPPSDMFLKYLKTFIRKGEKKYISFCLFRLRRVIQNGSRTCPPFVTELRAVKRQEPVHIEVLLKNGSSIFVKIDSAATAGEMLDVVAKNVKLNDKLGSSLMIALEMKHFSLGDGSQFVLDVVSECEQYINEIGGSLESKPWKLYLKKEMFTPWHDFEDKVLTNLIYHQIKEGIVTGEYGLQDPDLPSVIAQMCYEEAGNIQPSLLNHVIRQLSPLHISSFSRDDCKSFEAKVKGTYQATFGKTKPSVEAIQGGIVKHAASKWTLEFSRFFNFLGSIKYLKGSELYENVLLVIGINSSGIFVIDESSEMGVIARIDYPEIQEITRRKLTESNGYILKIISCEGTEVSLTIQSLLDSDFYPMLNKILNTLKKLSKFAMSVKDYKILDKTFLELQKGDLITLSERFCGQDLIHNSWCEGFNNRTKKTGNFLLNSVEIIPTMRELPESIIKSIRDVHLSGKKIQICQFVERLKHYTLKSYAKKSFTTIDSRENDEKPKSESSELWKYSKEEIKRPLLAKVGLNTEAAKEAVMIFRCTLQYTENNQNSTEIEEQLLHKIFGPGLKNVALRDEIYCQIMKQLTSNIYKQIENKTWELMWFLTGLFACEETLEGEVKKFLQSRRTIQVARECLAKFYKILDLNPRKCTPHLIEIEAVKNRPCHIFHRIYFPDDTNKFFKMHSLTKFKELKEAVLIRLNLNSHQEFSLFIQIMKRLFLAPDDYYVFDYLQEFKNWIETKKMLAAKWQYKICFMKHTWRNSFSSNELIDLKFNFPQEYNKYIQGYYEIPTEDMIQLAALLYKVYFLDYKTQQQPMKILQKVIPSKATNLMKPQTWHYEIQKNYKNHHLLSSQNDCKIKFLKHISKFNFQGLPYFAVIPEKSILKNYMLYSVTQRSNV